MTVRRKLRQFHPACDQQQELVSIITFIEEELAACDLSGVRQADDPPEDFNPESLELGTCASC
jgi:hypothetical protein